MRRSNRTREEVIDIYMPVSMEEKIVPRTAAHQMKNSRGDTRQKEKT